MNKAHRDVRQKNREIEHAAHIGNVRPRSRCATTDGYQAAMCSSRLPAAKTLAQLDRTFQPANHQALPHREPARTGIP